MTETLIVPAKVNHFVGIGPFRIDRPLSAEAGIVATVRGSGKYVAEGLPARAVDFLTLIADLGNFRVRVGNFVPQTFAPGDVTVLDDTITFVDHGYLTAQGPYHFTSSAGLPAGLNVAATGVLTLAGNAGNTETVTLDAKVYTFQTVLTDVDGNVLIGATASDSIDNLIAAITLGAGAGTLYAASTTLHPTVTAAAGVGDTMDVTAKNAGAAGNTIVTTETLAAGSFSAATLLGGQDVDYWIIKVDDDTFKVATSEANARAGTAVDLTSQGSGTHTITGMHNVAAAPAASVADGTGAILIPEGRSVVIPASAFVTVQGVAATDTLTYFWSS